MRRKITMGAKSLMYKMILVTALVAGPNLGTAQMADHSGHAMGSSPDAQAWEDINARMHEDMMIEYTGDPDVDFILGMIPHHQGAVEMAEYVLQHGQDPEVRALAQSIIDSQEAEIVMMQEWLKARGID
jgi:uncharacterized protein (DUF305 family)